MFNWTIFSNNFLYLMLFSAETNYLTSKLVSARYKCSVKSGRSHLPTSFMVLQIFFKIFLNDNCQLIAI